MPTLQVSLIRGYSGPVRQRLCRRLTAATTAVLGAAPEAVTVFLHEVDPDGYARGGHARTPAAAPEQTPEEVVTAFLAAMEARDLETAATHLADGFVMTFPGSGPMTRLDELVAWARGRYRFVRKTFEAVDTADHLDHAVVTCHGHLHGEWPDGTPFEGVRFIDRFEVRHGRLTRQDVWNDLALVSP
ncbi:nuclear transport factor 2 family protein [Roseospira goensis]|uniref:Phenylpyruvate tautomerase PptA (4-oxalocrotonate tautomerase family) n=1 Tax=Roseospira goensis TaxID=391922 RepID=A0A7W6S259_9PROT|nr:nuclear transport factor 2 family protein [Roseospira goensis]MBB4287464.1 phenylpyruvate tautomerase PptA (4-oxalocrotonate tautomerase family) [Roseospira goensis]